MAEWTKETEKELDRLIEKGTKAWAGTPDNWVDELRGGVEKMDMQVEFEKWHSHDGEWPQGLGKDAKGVYKYARTENDWSVWQAAFEVGRESMRQEAMKAADDQWVKDPRVSASDAIKAIV